MAGSISSSRNATLARNKASILSRGWVQGVCVCFIFSFLLLGISAYRTFAVSMPLPKRVVNEQGKTIFTAEEITRGQELFQDRGVIQYGSVLGHGAYLGQDFTAGYLHLAADDVASQLQKSGVTDIHTHVVKEFRTNRYNPHTGTLVYTDHQAQAYEDLVEYYTTFFSNPSIENGFQSHAINSSQEIRDLTAFFSWTAWVSVAQRPGHSYSYTNNWPYEKRVDNGPNANLIIWSVLPVIMLFIGMGSIFAIYGKWDQKIGWDENETRLRYFRQPSFVTLSTAQRATAWFFLLVGILYLAQTFLGGAIKHYRSDFTNLFEIDLARVLPFHLAQIWHLQLAPFWIVTTFLAGGIFLTEHISAKEIKGQSILTYALFAVLIIVIFGSLISEGLTIHGQISADYLFLQQWEYLNLPHLFRILLTIGLILWIVIMWRGARDSLSSESKKSMPWLLFFTGLGVPAFYIIGLAVKVGRHISVTDYWHFWVVRLWVEDFLELFITAMMAYIFVLLGVVRKKIAVHLLLLDIILYICGGVIGALQYRYFSGTPLEEMALGAFFSAGEVIPLTFLTIEAWTFLRSGSKQYSEHNDLFPHRWAVMYLLAVGFWNFVSTGVFGFLINLPIVSYYGFGTSLTTNHTDVVMYGVYGMLAIGCALFGMRYIIPADKWPEKSAKISFWCSNIGLMWMVFATLFPLGILQLYYSVSRGYFFARSIGYISKPGNAKLEWIRTPGDLLIIFGGALPVLWIAILAVRYFRSTPAPVAGNLVENEQLSM